MKNLNIEKIFLAGLYITLIVVTLVFLPTVYRQFDIGKAFPFKIMMSTITIGFCLWQIFHFKKEWWSERSKTFFPFIVPIVILVANYLFSTFMSDDLWMSMTGLYERQIGTSGFLACLLLFFYLTLLTQEKKMYETGLWVLRALTAFLGIAAVSQYFDICTFGLPNPPAGRSNVFLGNANFLGDQIVFFIPLFLSAFLLTPNKKTKILQLAFFAFASIGTLLTGTRGAYLALGGSTLAFLILFLFVHDREEHKKSNFVIILLLSGGFLLFLASYAVTQGLDFSLVFIALIALGLIFAGSFALAKKCAGMVWKKTLPWIMGLLLLSSGLSFVGNSLRVENNIFDRYYSLFEMSGKATPRYHIWKDGLTFIKDIPLWGVGPEMFREKFMSYKSRETEILEPHTHYDNPHNNYLYILFSLGALGLLMHLWILGRFFKMSFSLLSDKNQSQQNRVVALGFFTTMVSYAIWTIPGFEFLSSIACFWTFMALFCLFYAQAGGEMNFWELRLLGRFQKSLSLLTLKPLRMAFFSLLSLLALLLMYQNYLIYSGDKAFVDSLVKKGGGELHGSIASLEEALDYNPRETYYHLNLAKVYIDLARRDYDIEMRKRYIAKAEKALQDGLAHPWSPDLIYATWANARLTMGDKQGAIDQMHKVLEVYPATIEYRKFLNYIENEFGK